MGHSSALCRLQLLSAKLSETSDPDRRQMRERVQQAVQRTAGLLEEAVRSGLPAEDVDSRAQVRPSPPRPAGPAPRRTAPCPATLAAAV